MLLQYQALTPRDGAGMSTGPVPSQIAQDLGAAVAVGVGVLVGVGVYVAVGPGSGASCVTGVAVP